VVDVYDLVVIGGGAGGFAAAIRAAQLGATVALVEERQVGGNCMRHACIPVQVWMAAARTVGVIRKAGRLGIQAAEPVLDMDVFRERKDVIVESLRMGAEGLLFDYGVSLVQGRGRLVSKNAVQVDGSTLVGGPTIVGGQIGARNVVIATGSVAAQLPIEGIDLPGVIGTEEAIALRQVPPRVAVVANSPAHLELAQLFCVLGSQVTVIASGPRLLPEADREIAQRLGKLFHDAGMAIHRNAAIDAIRQREDGTLSVVLAGGRGEVVADQVLAARRLPNTAGLGLRELGVKMASGAVLVDEHMRTGIPTVYAVGDATATAMWSHKANAEGIVAAESAMGLSASMDYAAMPRCLYTWPEVAWVGWTEEQAEARGYQVAVGKIPVALNAYAAILGEQAGMIKVVADGKYGKILGVHMMAPGAANLINVASVAMLSEATVGELMRCIPHHPSMGEALVDAAMDVEKRSLRLPRS
jgi:dihydrolipoamide dehydrogenase